MAAHRSSLKAEVFSQHRVVLDAGVGGMHLRQAAAKMRVVVGWPNMWSSSHTVPAVSIAPFKPYLLGHLDQLLG